MNAPGLTFLAVLFFAMENVLISRYLGEKVSPVVIMLVTHPVPAFIALVVFLSRKQFGYEWKMPEDNFQWIVIFIASVFFTAGDFLYLSALGTGRLSTVTIMICTLPVVATFINVCFSRNNLPTTDEVIAWICVVTAVALVTFKPFSKQ
jgi:drug/metabolite transporter (DMT)-like permease